MAMEPKLRAALRERGFDSFFIRGLDKKIARERRRIERDASNAEEVETAERWYREDHLPKEAELHERDKAHKEDLVRQPELPLDDPPF